MLILALNVMILSLLLSKSLQNSWQYHKESELVLPIPYIDTKSQPSVNVSLTLEVCPKHSGSRAMS